MTGNPQMADNVLIINLTRFGDLLQTQPLLSGLAANGANCGLVCLANFVDAVPMMRHVSDAWPLRGSMLLSRLHGNWPKALNMITGFVRGIRSNASYSHIINLTPTNSARLLARMLAQDGANVLGFGMDEHGFGVNSGYWAAFLNVASKRRGSSPFNIADVFRMTALPLLGAARPGQDSGKLGVPPQEARVWAGDFLAKYPFVRPGKNLIALQPGASNPDRQWPVEHFAVYAARLHEQGYISMLLGSAAEKPLAEAFAARVDFPFVDATGQTTIPQLAALLEQSLLLATNDTGTMHLASGLGVRCLAFFLATAQPWDTGPYAAGNCCLEPALACHPCSFNQICGFDHACLRQIGPDLAASLALGQLKHGSWLEGLTDEMRASKARIWLTGRDACGFSDIQCISGHQGQGQSAWLAWQRYFWRQVLDNVSGIQPSCSPKKPDFPAPANYVEHAAPVLRQVAGILESLAGAAALAGKNPRAGKILLQGCDNVQSLLDACAPLASLGDFWRELRNDSDDIGKFAAQLGVLSKNLTNFAVELVGKE